MSTRSSRSRPSALESSPSRKRKGVSPSRSPARNRKVSPPAQSPSRKSPARKSPSRKPASKFPARKSPSRAIKESNDSTTQKSSGSRPPIKDVESKNDNVGTVLPNVRGTRSRRVEYSIKDFTGEIKQNEGIIDEKLNGFENLLNSKEHGLRNRRAVEDFIPRRSGRLREYFDNGSDIRHSSSKSVSIKSISKSIDISDGESSAEEVLNRPRTSITRKLATPLRESISKMVQVNGKWEFGGRPGSMVLTALMPLTVFTLLVSCNKSCSIKSALDSDTYRNSSWYSPFALILVGSHVLLQAFVLCLSTFGTKTLDEFGTRYSFNALFSTLVTVISLFMLDFLKVIDSNMILKEYVQLAATSYIFAILLSFVLYWKSRKLEDDQRNSYGNSGYMLYDFWMGREIHPLFYKLDIKIWLSRICNITALILAALLFKHGFEIPSTDVDIVKLENYKELLNKLHYKPTVLLFSMMQIVYLLNFIMKEHKMVSTFFWQSEGVGYLQVVASALYPFYFTSITKFIVNNEVSLSANTLIAASVLYLLGFFIMLISNNIKYEFRKNPLNPSFSNMDTMPTFHGKKLLVSGMWGLIRHPNYTGDILIHVALALPGLMSMSLAAVPALTTIVVLLHRAWRDHSRCQRRYGAAWQRYCKRVPSVLIPKVF